MKNTFSLLTLFLLFHSFAFCQSELEKRESVVSELCEIINQAEKAPNPVLFQERIDTIIIEYLSGFPEESQEDEAKTLLLRLERNCDSFKRLLDQAEPPKGDWYIERENPQSRISASECEKYLLQPVHYYIDPSGDIVTVEVKDGIYTETFPDGTFSKLSFHWLGECRFMLEFIESNHEIKKRISVPGDQYFYKLIDKNEGSFIASTEIKGSTDYYSFKIYLNKPIKFSQ